jgi:hypothetical protein
VGRPGPAGMCSQAGLDLQDGLGRDQAWTCRRLACEQAWTCRSLRAGLDLQDRLESSRPSRNGVRLCSCLDLRDTCEQEWGLNLPAGFGPVGCVWACDLLASQPGSCPGRCHFSGSFCGGRWQGPSQQLSAVVAAAASAAQHTHTHTHTDIRVRSLLHHMS